MANIVNIFNIIFASVKPKLQYIMAKSISRQLAEKAQAEAAEKAAKEKSLLDNAGKTPEELEAEKIANAKFAAEKEAEKDKKPEDKTQEKPTLEELKKKHPNLDESGLALLAEIEGAGKPEERKEPEPAKPVVNALTPEQQAKLDLLDSILADPDKAVYFEAVKEGKILDTLSKFLPKGEDYSKLSKKEAIEKSLIMDGATKEEIEKELESFDTLSYYDKGKRYKDALEILNSKNPSISPEITAEFKKTQEKQKQFELVHAQREANASKILEAEVSNLIGKDINGITITQENSKDLMAAIIANTPRVPSPQGGFDLDVKTGIERGKRIYAYDKVVSAKDKKIQDLQKLVKDLSSREELRVRPAANYVRPLERKSEASKNNIWLK